MQSTEASLIDVLDEQIVCARAMLGALGAESEALRRGDTDGLNAASAGKAELGEALERLEQERRQLADALEREGSPAAGSDAGKKWRQLLELLAECRDNNLRNGSLVAARREQIASALQLIGGPTAEIYDARGRENRNRTRQQLGSA